MSTSKKKVVSVLLSDADLCALEKILKETRVSESMILRGLIRLALKQKIPSLKLIRLGVF